MSTIVQEQASSAVPSPLDLEIQGEALMERLSQVAAQGREIVVVQGLGFVGAAVASVLASVKRDGAPLYEVVGVDLATPAAYWKIARLQAGEFPFSCPDPELVRMAQEGVTVAGNLHATSCEEVYSLADVIIADVPLDVKDRTECDTERIEIRWGGFEAAMRAVGRRMRPDALVIVETTVPAGTTQRVARKVLEEERARRGLKGDLLLAHAYERVMPGPRYAESIRRFWRSFAGIDAASTRRAQVFLASFIDTERFPTRDLKDTQASELAKLLENSYRATNIALIYEWTLMAEDIGVNLFEIVDSIRVRKGTHDNMRYPGFGVGGYCLTKDSLLAQWALKNFYSSQVQLSMTMEALRTNYRMPLHSLELARTMVGPLAKRTVAVCGLCYLPNVPDTRNAPVEVVYEALRAEQAQIRLHDPLVNTWVEHPEVPVTQDLGAALLGADVVVLAVNHEAYGKMTASDWARLFPCPIVVVDATNVISDEQAEVLHACGHRLMGVGKGHWRTLGYHQHV